MTPRRDIQEIIADVRPKVLMFELVAIGQHPRLDTQWRDVHTHYTSIYRKTLARPVTDYLLEQAESSFFIIERFGYRMRQQVGDWGFSPSLIYQEKFSALLQTIEERMASCNGLIEALFEIVKRTSRRERQELIDAQAQQRKQSHRDLLAQLEGLLSQIKVTPAEQFALRPDVTVEQALAFLSVHLAFEELEIRLVHENSVAHVSSI